MRFFKSFATACIEKEPMHWNESREVEKGRELKSKTFKNLVIFD
ncbi:hypothetical protein [Myroides odoratus]